MQLALLCDRAGTEPWDLRGATAFELTWIDKALPAITAHAKEAFGVDVNGHPMMPSAYEARMFPL